MKICSKKWQNVVNSARRGFSLVELLIAVVVLGILSAMVLAAGTASQNRARVGVAQNDLDSMKNAAYQALMANPKFMKYSDVTPGGISAIIDAINLELDEAWQFTPCGVALPEGATEEQKKAALSSLASGGVAYTKNQRDPWGSPYSLYVYTDDCTTGYNDATGTPCGNSDSVVTVVIASAGRNGTGVGLGFDGTNVQAGSSTNALDLRTAMVNNTDGIDDMGVIIRNKNGQLLTASFGYDNATLGLLKGVQWVFGVRTSAGTGAPAFNGVYYNYLAATPGNVTPTKGGSIDQFKTSADITEASVTAANGFLQK